MNEETKEKILEFLSAEIFDERIMRRCRNFLNSPLESEWISVKDRLPKRNTKVLVFWGNKISVGDIWDEEIGYVETSGLMIKPSYWMPLPELPEKE